MRLGEWNGETYGIVVAHESHNHPSQVVPFEGAATGIGGIVRDVLCMGAEVIGVADPLRFGRLGERALPLRRAASRRRHRRVRQRDRRSQRRRRRVLRRVVRRQRARQRRRARAGQGKGHHPFARAAGQRGLGHRARRKSDGSQRLRRRVVLVADARRRRCGSEQRRRPSARSVPEKRHHARVVRGVRGAARARDHRGLQGSRRGRPRGLQRGVVRGGRDGRRGRSRSRLDGAARSCRRK